MSDAHLQPSRAQLGLTKPGLSGWFIDHPIATVLLTLGTLFLGVLAFPQLPVAARPSLSPSRFFPIRSPTRKSTRWRDLTIDHERTKAHLNPKMRTFILFGRVLN